MLGEWLNAGQHITAIGADDPAKCELDATALKRAWVFVDSLASAAANGDVHWAFQAGKYNLEDVSGEIGEVLPARESDARPPRTSRLPSSLASVPKS